MEAAMIRTITRNLEKQGVRLDSGRMRRSDCERMAGRTGEGLLRIGNAADARIACEELLEHTSDSLALLKSLKEFIPKKGSATAHHMAVKLLSDVRKLEQDLVQFSKNRYFRQDRETRMAAELD
jgi:glutamyl/glutaminyl-tRNA synthetase